MKKFIHFKNLGLAVNQFQPTAHGSLMEIHTDLAERQTQLTGINSLMLLALLGMTPPWKF